MKIKSIFYVVLGSFVLFGLYSCKSSHVAQSSLPLVTYSNSRSEVPWRRALIKQLRMSLPSYIDVFRFQMKSAENNPLVQINDLNTYIDEKPKVLMVSPTTPVIETALDRAYRNGIPIVMLDNIVGNKYTTYVGADDYKIGQDVAKYMGQKLNGQGTILIMPGPKALAITQLRMTGFDSIMKSAYPAIKVIVGPDSQYILQNAWVNMDLILQKKTPFDAVFALNDQMALGVSSALEKAGTAKKMIVGIDGVSLSVMRAIKDGKIDSTFTYPLPGGKALELVVQILKGQPVQKKYILPTMRLDAANVDQYVKDNPYLVE